MAEKKTKDMMQGIQEFTIKRALEYLEKDPENNAPKVLEMVDKVCPDDWFAEARKSIHKILDEKGNWYDLLLKIYDLDPGVRKTFFENFILNAGLKGFATQRKLEEKHNCNIPWAILLDPTSACNLQCTGCWAAEYGHQLSLDLETIDSIIKQGKELGTYFYIYTGGEPLVRKKDLIKICEMHPDCEFLSFTNGTLIDEEFCKEMLRVKNFVPAISLEGFEVANDGRRGDGIYDKVMNAMRLLKENKLPFGISTCYTSKNVDDVSSEAYFDLLVESGALFVWFFHYMPVGNSAVTELLASPEQREKMYHAIREFRNTKPIFGIDFQNDGEYVKGCVAGGRRYFHINAKGDAEPCVFIHYSNANVHDTSILNILKSPIFQAYHDNQPFNDNHLRPCPMLENPECLRKMVKETGAVNTDYMDQETVDHLCDKCKSYAENWISTAEELWEESHSSK